MKPRTFTTKIGACNEIWLANVLGLLQGQKSIDLSDSQIGVELKSRWDKYHLNFAVHHYQLKQFKEENPSLKLFWAFMIYGLTETPRKIKVREGLEQYVSRREVWIMPREWVMRFPESKPKTGPYVYVHESHFPSLDYFKTFERDRAAIHVPKDSILEERLI